jgi:hypothetical protein
MNQEDISSRSVLTAVGVGGSIIVGSGIGTAHRDDVDRRKLNQLRQATAPYHDLETYTDQDEDLSNMDYPEFLETYREIIAQGVERLRDERFAAFVVSEVQDDAGYYRSFVSDTVQAFEDAGMHLYNDAVLVNTPGTLPVRVRNYFEKGRKLGRMHQNVLVFYQGDPDPSNIREQVGQVQVPSVVLGDGDSEDDSAETGAWAVEQDPEAQAAQEDNDAE